MQNKLYTRGNAETNVAFSIAAFCNAPKLGTTSAPCCSGCSPFCLCVTNGALAVMNFLFFVASCILLAMIGYLITQSAWAFVLEMIGYLITLAMTVIAVVMLKQKQMWWDLNSVDQRPTIAQQSHSGGIELPTMGQPVVQTIVPMPPGGVPMSQGAIVSTAVPIKGGTF